MLHLVFKSPSQSSGLAECLAIAAPDDEILLLEDAVITTVKDNHWQLCLEAKKDRIFVLEEDLKARGLENFVMDGIKSIDIQGFVELTEKHSTQISW